jgi:glycosyltransferase involved in cell wall biosynthesis
LTPLTADAIGCLLDLPDAASAQRFVADFPGPVPEDMPVLVPELFYDAERCAFHARSLSARRRTTGFIVYDFIPWLHPDRIGVARSAALMPYLRLVRDAPHTAFISQRTHDEYVGRIRRRGPPNAGPVLPLGADGLRIERQHFAADRTLLVVIGALNGGKNQDLILQAFEQATARKAGHLELVLVGQVYAQWMRPLLAAARARGVRFWLIEDADDAQLGALLRRARATLYGSEIEGFGLPPLESLHAGIPVVAVAGLPSLGNVPEDGQIRLPAASVQGFADAILTLADDDACGSLWQGAARLSLPTWADFARACAAWMTGAVGPAQAAPTSAAVEVMLAPG